MATNPNPTVGNTPAENADYIKILTDAAKQAKQQKIVDQSGVGFVYRGGGAPGTPAFAETVTPPSEHLTNPVIPSPNGQPYMAKSPADVTKSTPAATASPQSTSDLNAAIASLVGQSTELAGGTGWYTQDAQAVAQAMNPDGNITKENAADLAGIGEQKDAQLAKWLGGATIQSEKDMNPLMAAIGNFQRVYEAAVPTNSAAFGKVGEAGRSALAAAPLDYWLQEMQSWLNSQFTYSYKPYTGISGEVPPEVKSILSTVSEGNLSFSNTLPAASQNAINNAIVSSGTATQGGGNSSLVGG